MAYESDVAIQAIVFHPDGGFDITYAEQNNIRTKGTLVNQFMSPPGMGDLPVEEVLDAIRELLDLALAASFDDPTERISRR